MNLAKELLHQIADPSLSFDERVHLRCQLAKQLEEAGNYESAREAMSDLWQRVGERPSLEGLSQVAAAEVLLRSGVLSGWIGSIRQIDGAQESAKNLISDSIVIFEALNESRKLAEANIELAVCYWREGGFDEARVMLGDALRSLVDNGDDLKALALLRSAAVEKCDNRLSDALRILTSAAPLIETSSNETLKGRFHNEFGNVLKNLATVESREDHIDRALIEYAAASYHFEHAGHARYQAYVENNLALLFIKANSLSKAHDHLDRAQALFTTLRDRFHLAQVDETRARILLAAGRVEEAEKFVAAAVRTLEKGDEHSLLSEALMTHGIALARLADYEKARMTLERAFEVAEQAGDLKSAGQAALIIIEEVRSHLSADELCTNVDRARTLLKNTQDVSEIKRLTEAACQALFLLHDFHAAPDWTKFSLREAKDRCEAHFIELAFKETGGSVTGAARLLGLPSHQSLLFMLDNRHQNLVKLRKPIRPRRRSVIPKDADDKGFVRGR